MRRLLVEGLLWLAESPSAYRLAGNPLMVRRDAGGWHICAEGRTERIDARSRDWAMHVVAATVERYRLPPAAA